VTTGRNIEAEAIREPPEDKDEGSKAKEKRERELAREDREPLEEGRPIDETRFDGMPQTEAITRARLSPSEMEKRLSRYAEFAEKLTPEERRRVREFHRKLRDLR
jgi:hypothetical protein